MEKISKLIIILNIIFCSLYSFNIYADEIDESENLNEDINDYREFDTKDNINDDFDINNNIDDDKLLSSFEVESNDIDYTPLLFCIFICLLFLTFKSLIWGV